MRTKLESDIHCSREIVVVDAYRRDVLNLLLSIEEKLDQLTPPSEWEIASTDGPNPPSVGGPVWEPFGVGRLGAIYWRRRVE